MEWYPAMLLKCCIVIGTFTFSPSNNTMIIPCISVEIYLQINIQACYEIMCEFGCVYIQIIYLDLLQIKAEIAIVWCNYIYF